MIVKYPILLGSMLVAATLQGKPPELIRIGSGAIEQRFLSHDGGFTVDYPLAWEVLRSHGGGKFHLRNPMPVADYHSTIHVEGISFRKAPNLEDFFTDRGLPSGDGGDALHTGDMKHNGIPGKWLNTTVPALVTGAEAGGSVEKDKDEGTPAARGKNRPGSLPPGRTIAAEILGPAEPGAGEVEEKAESVKMTSFFFVKRYRGYIVTCTYHKDAVATDYEVCKQLVRSLRFF